ncbi:uncharacterized protein V3H82_011978 [Fundulus diaphanus]
MTEKLQLRWRKPARVWKCSASGRPALRTTQNSLDRVRTGPVCLLGSLRRLPAFSLHTATFTGSAAFIPPFLTSFSCCFSLEEILSRSLWTEHVNQPSAAAVNIWTWCQQNQSHIFRRSKRATTHKQEEVGSENRRNTRTKLTPKKAESSSSGCRFDSQSSRKDGTLQKIGDFLQSSPTLLGSKAKKKMSPVSGRLDPDSAAASSSLSLRAKRGRKKLYRPEISCPMDMPPHPMINQETDGEGQSHHDIIKRRLRSRVAKS